MSVPGVWEGGSDALEAGACFMRISSFLGAFLPSAPAWGRRAVLVMLHSGGTGWGTAPGAYPRWHRAAVSEPELFGMSALCFTNVQKLCETKQNPFLPGKGPKMLRFCLP